MSKKKRERTTWPSDPPLETFQATLARTNRHLLRHRFWQTGDAKKNFEQFVSEGHVDLDQFAIGNGDHLADANWNASKAVDLIRDMATAVETHAKPTPRAEAAGMNVLASAQMVNTALVTHMRANSWYVNGTLVLLRTALELAARGGFIALGSGDERQRWENGPKLPTQSERRASQFTSVECFNAIKTPVMARHASADDPYVVYSWLCRFTHLGHDALVNQPTHEDGYATFAYIAWIGAVMAELVLGVPNIAQWPKVLPEKLPWK